MTIANQSITLSTETIKKHFNFHQTSVNVFVETGTFEGGGVQTALDAGFKEVISVEVDAQHFVECSRHFWSKLYKSVFLHFADTTLHFERILEGYSLQTYKKQTLYWIDAHWGNNTEAGMEYVPLLSELRVIEKFFIEGDVIMVDDVRLMGVSFWKDVTLDKVKEVLESYHMTNYVIEFTDSKAAPNDILVFKPKAE